MNLRPLLIIGCVLSVLLILPASNDVPAADGPNSPGHTWQQLIAEAERLGLPTKFLKAIPPDFVRVEFDDLQAFAAEYHLGEHRMVLNRTLSLNGAGGVLRPLHRLTPTELETLYHELFHAYMDVLATLRAGDRPDPLLVFARKQQQCRYSAVLITPVVQRKGETEERFLSEQESWEALNEAWAVFVGWAVWNQLELKQRTGQSLYKEGKGREGWIQRLQTADREGNLRGYYEPEQVEERAIARKRFLAPASRISPGEVRWLMEAALGYPIDLVERTVKSLMPVPPLSTNPQPCG